MELSSQQILRLCTHFHRAFLRKDQAQLRELSCGLLKKRHLLRASEVAMALNHLAHLKVMDESLWNDFSDALIEAYVEPDCKALGLAANAYARGLLQHQEVFEFVAREVERLAALEEMDPRNIAMVVNAFSKLRLRDEELMTAISSQLKSSAEHLNPVDLATVVNGYARLWLHEEDVLDAMQKPMLHVMSSFSIQNLAMIAHALGRFRRRDLELLEALVAQLRRHEVIPPRNLGSIVHAFVNRLNFYPDNFLRVMENSLLRGIHQMELPDLVLTVSALKNVPVEKLQVSSELRGAIFSHCLQQMPQLTSSVILGVIELAVRLGHGSGRFWQEASRGCSLSSWKPSEVAALAVALAQKPGVAPQLVQAILAALRSGGLRKLDLEVLTQWQQAMPLLSADLQAELEAELAARVPGIPG